MESSWQDVAAFRAEVYRFLGLCLLEPVQEDRAQMLKPEFWREFPLAPANDVMRTALGKLVKVTSGLASLPGDAALQAVQLEFASLFLGAGNPLAPPWESMYRTPERLLFGQPAFRVREFMAQFGLAPVAQYRQPEDHLGLELMLLAAASESATSPSVGEWRESAKLQAAFIADHPLGWVEDLERDAAANGQVGFYAALIGLVRSVLLWDQELLKEYVSEN
jgi:TorA maturation chaperone TorD